MRCPVALARLGQLLLDVGQLLLGLAKLGGERGNHARRLLCRIQPGRLLRDRSGVSSLVKIFAGAHLRRRVDIARRRKPRLRLLLLLAQTPPLECIGRAAPWVAGPQVERVARGRARVLEARKDRLAALLHVGLVWLFEPLPPPLRRVGRAAPRVEGVARRVGRQMTFHGAVGVAGLRLRQPLPPPLLRRGRAVAPLRVPCPELGRPGVGLQGWAGGPGQRCDPVCWRQPCREAGAVKRGEEEHVRAPVAWVIGEELSLSLRCRKRILHPLWRLRKGENDESGTTARWHEGCSEKRRETATRDRKRQTP